MLILLPPSETKAPGGKRVPLDLDTLSFPELNPTRRELIDAVVGIAADVPASLAALGLSERQRDEVARNAELRAAATLPAVRRYTGVLYDGLGITEFTRAERRRADERLAVASALFGLVRGADPIPAYRLSGDSALPGLPTLRTVWRPVLQPVLREFPGLVVDLRSGKYAALAPVPTAVTVRVVTVAADGRRTTVSHHNKSYKGRLAAVWARARREPSTVDDLVTTALHAGLKVTQTADRELELLTD